MPRPDLVKPLAAQLSRLRHPNGTELRFLHHSTFGHGEKAAAHIRNIGERTIEAIINEIELAGGTITMPGDPQPVAATDAPGPWLAGVVCTHCGRRIAQVKVNPDMTIPLSSLAQRSLAQLPTTCDEHEALTNAEPAIMGRR
jgi:hypothetical protein